MGWAMPNIARKSEGMIKRLPVSVDATD